jgi:deoxyadenosine/deoxycytidine kinase
VSHCSSIKAANIIQRNTSQTNNQPTNHMNNTKAVYDSWFDPVLASSPSLVPDGFIYLRADPSTCLQR